MKKLMRVLALMLAFALTAVFIPTGAGAVSFDCDVETYSDSILLVNLDTGMEVFGKDETLARIRLAISEL